MTQDDLAIFCQFFIIKDWIYHIVNLEMNARNLNHVRFLWTHDRKSCLQLIHDLSIYLHVDPIHASTHLFRRWPCHTKRKWNVYQKYRYCLWIEVLLSIATFEVSRSASTQLAKLHWGQTRISSNVYIHFSKHKASSSFDQNELKEELIFKFWRLIFNIFKYNPSNFFEVYDFSKHNFNLLTLQQKRMYHTQNFYSYTQNMKFNSVIVFTKMFKFVS